MNKATPGMGVALLVLHSFVLHPGRLSRGLLLIGRDERLSDKGLERRWCCVAGRARFERPHISRVQ